MTKKDSLPYVGAILLATSLGAAWHVPGSIPCAILGWVSALCIAFLLSLESDSYRFSYIAGFFVNLLGFYWLFQTISHFGGFPLYAAAPIFALFLAVSALQFPIATFIFRNLPPFLHRANLGGAIAWTLSELVAIRIFPWHLGHTQLGFTEFAQFAELGGATAISFMMLWVSESLFRLFRGRSRVIAVLVPSLALILIVLYGVTRVREFSSRNLSKYPFQKVLLVQGDLSLEEKHDPISFSRNLTTYVNLTTPLASPDVLVVWPETTIMQWVASDVGEASLHPELSKIPPHIPALVGALTYDTPERIFNSALAIFPDGQVPSPYNKRILMPFGEYTPGTMHDTLSSFVPKPIQEWLRDVNGTAPNFTPGVTATVFNFPMQRTEQKDGAYSLKVSPLICYEDVVTSPARESVLQGAELLANLTNDAWFGRSEAPYQHNLIASFRAIENRRYLIRATNSGLSAVIDPLGHTTLSLPIFTPGTLLAEVHLISYKTIYTLYSGGLSWLFVVISGVTLVGNIIQKRFTRKKVVPTW